MQPQVVGSAPAMQPAPIPSPTSPVGGGKRPDTTMIIHTMMLVAALILALLGVMGDAWSTEKKSVTEETMLGNISTTFDNKTGLDDFSMSFCTDGFGEQICFTEQDAYGTSDLSGAYDNCTSQAEASGANTSQIESSCGALGESASAGFTGMIFISLGILVLIVTLVATGLEFRGTSLPLSQFYPFAGSAFILTGVIAWLLMMPDPPEGSDPSLGYSAWLTIISILLASAAGGYTIYTNRNSTTIGANLSTSHRPPGLGARTLSSDSEAREFVLRETAMGNQTLSIVEDGQLFRITRATRGETGTHSEDIFMTRMDALCGFTHARFDWLDTTRYLWNILAIAGLALTMLAFENASLIFYTNWFILMFAIGTIISMLQFADPELITFETKTGKHRLLIYRAGSNRQLTNASMDIIDSAMRDALRGEEIDPSALNAVADAIEAEIAEARRIAEEAVAAAEAERIQAAAMAQAHAEHQAKMQAEALEQARAQVAATTPAPTPPVVAPTPPVQTTPPPAPMAAPAATPIPPVMNPPTPAPPTPIPPAPAAPNPPPPAPMPPPLQDAPLPPPPSNLDLNLASAMGIPTETISEPPEIQMQAAPRDDSLSEGEKADLLSELDED